MGVATHISAALAMMTSSLLMAANTLGLVPDPARDRMVWRETISGLVARTAIDAAETGEFASVAAVAEDLVRVNPDVRSMGMRLADGTLVASTGLHGELWTRETRFVSSPSQARIPITRGGEPFAEVEIRFADAGASGLMAVVRHPLTPLVLFLGGAGFFGYRLYMRRVLQYLDPSAVVPAHVRVFLDSLVEAVVVLDMEERIVLANRSWGRLAGVDPLDCVGRRLSGFGWTDARGVAPVEQLPWIESIDDGAVRADIRLAIRGADGEARPASGRCAPITAPDGAQRGVVISLADMTESEVQRGELEKLVRTLAKHRREIERQNEELQRLATTDSLTGCLNRRELHRRGESHWSLSGRAGSPIACIMLDIDHFKSINDTYGHQAGDGVLVRIASLLLTVAREHDVVGRFGGEEFCLVLPETGRDGAVALAERLRVAIAEASVGGISVTASFGVACRDGTIESLEALFDAADRALYEAKRLGRNRVCTDRRGGAEDAGVAA